jgi:hypothetical protein
MGGVRSRLGGCFWIATLPLAVLVLGCGHTSKRDAGSTGGVAGGTSTAGAASGGSSPLPTADEPNCAVALSAGAGRHCATYQDGSVWCWGASGPSNFEPSEKPVRVEGLSDVIYVGLGPTHGCALNGRNELWCWGDNESGQIDDSGQSPLAPRLVSFPGLDDAIGLGLDESQTCIVGGFAAVFCWGTDAAGTRSPPHRIDVGADFKYLTMLGSTPALVDDAGRIISLREWSTPTVLSELGYDNAWLGNNVPTCVLKRSHSLWCTPFAFDADQPLLANVALGETVVQAGTGELFVCARDDRGRVWCQGLNVVGQAATGESSTFASGDFIPSLSDVRALSVALHSACALKGDGSVWCWGAYGKDTQSNVPVPISTCTGQERVPLPTSGSVPPPEPAERLAEAGRARGQALCACAFGQLEASCVDAETFAPNPACMKALASNDTEYMTCVATWLWREAACYDEQPCIGDGRLEACPFSGPCAPAKSDGIVQYCKRNSCALDPQVRLSSSQICDGRADCEDGSDERNCTPNAQTFECETGASSIARERRCDAVRDCDDGSDERYCP